MNKKNFHFRLTLTITILLGIILLLVLGVKDPMPIATTFSMVWAVYPLILLGDVFLVEGKRN